MVDIIARDLTKAPNEEGFLKFMVLSNEEWERVKNHFQENKSDGFTDDLLNLGYTKGYIKGRADTIDECIRLAEESCYKDIDMLISYFKELKVILKS